MIKTAKKAVVSKTCGNLQLSFKTLEIAFPGTIHPNPPYTKSWIRPSVGRSGKAEKRPLLAIFHLRLVWEIAGYSKDNFQGLASPSASWVLDC